MKTNNYGIIPADVYLSFPETRHSAAFTLSLLRKGDQVNALQGEQRFTMGSNRFQSEGWLWIHSGHYAQKFGSHAIGINKWKLRRGKTHDGLVEWSYNPDKHLLNISVRLYKLSIKRRRKAIEGQINIYLSVLEAA